MAHPYKQHKEVHAGKRRAHEMAAGGYKRGGHVGAKAASKMTKKELVAHEKAETKAEGKASGGRLDKYARGGGTKKHGKGHHTHINIMVAPKGGDQTPPPLGGMGAPPPAAPMVPKGPMPPPGGGLGAGPPGMPPPPPGPGGMKRGGGVYSGISSKKNIEHWAKRTGSNTKYADGGAIAPLKPPHMKGGAGGAEGRLNKAKAYGLKPNKAGG